MDKITSKSLPGFIPAGRALGFDSLFDMIGNALPNTNQAAYPPYNVINIKDEEDEFMIEFALAGFNLDEIEISLENNQLTVAGNKTDTISEDDAPEVTYLHKGISTRSFKREFVMADRIVVDGAEFENGILTVFLHRELPKAANPRSIKIKNVT